MALDNAVDAPHAPGDDAGAGALDAAGAGALDAAPPAFHADQWKSVARHFQAALAVAVVLAFVSLGTGTALGEPLAGAFGVIGLGLGAYNGRRLWTETTSLKGEPGDARKSMAFSSLRRLGFVTLMAFLIALIYRQDGWVVFVGLVAFQLVMISFLLRPLRSVIRAC